MPGQQNRLAAETSPYLQQHAANPVDWYPWGEPALARAQAEDKPILLSIGYSACHWCHVMAHESFAHPATAALMNKYFVNIKVDREERPDIDKIYQAAQQLLTGRSGGWPLTMFLAPTDQAPFFGGTYFPPEARHGLPGFAALLEHIHVVYQQRRDDILAQNRALLAALERSSPRSLTPSSASDAIRPPPDLTAVIQCIKALQDGFDQRHGGFGGAPKFPHPGNLELLLQCQRLDIAAEIKQAARTMALTTLKKMAAGGIHDQLAGGFCRYSVDAHWLIPHFEKMLYDNGPLLGLYAAAAWLAADEPAFAATARQLAAWVRRDMQGKHGGYYSSLDADSEGEEGRFYVWDKQEVAGLLNERQFALFSQRYGLDSAPNFEGRWQLYISRAIADIAAGYGLAPAQVEAELDQARRILLQHREQRPWPGRDEKILTAWNALMIKGMATAARLCDGPTHYKYLGSAEAALSFILDELWRAPRLLATCKDGKAHLNAYLDDYACLLEAILALLAVRWDARWLRFAIALADALLAQFYDDEHGGFFFTSHDHERLLQRRKDFMDDALPAGNGVAVLALTRLAHLAGRRDYLAAAEQTLRTAAALLQGAPQACAALLCGLIEWHSPPPCIVLRGDEKTLRHWRQAIYRRHGLSVQCYAIPDNDQHDQDDRAAPLLAEKRAVTGRPVAYLCTGFACAAPLHDLGNILTALDAPV